MPLRFYLFGFEFQREKSTSFSAGDRVKSKLLGASSLVRRNLLADFEGTARSYEALAKQNGA